QHAQQGAVETHAAFPNPQQDHWVGEPFVAGVEQHVADAPAQPRTKHAVEQKVGKTVHVHARQTAGANANTTQPPGGSETEQVHDAVPVHLDRPQREGDGVYVVEMDHVGTQWRKSPYSRVNRALSRSVAEGP